MPQPVPASPVPGPMPAVPLHNVHIGKPRRNEIAEAIASSEFDMADFETDEGDSAVAVRHRESGAEFIVQEGSIAPFVVHWEIAGENRAFQAATLLGFADRWLNELRADLHTPNLWAEIGHESPRMASLAEGQENNPFTIPEQQQIAAIVAEVLKQARQTFELPEGELREVEATASYATEAATWIRGRVDWVNIVAGYIVNKVADGVLTPETMHKLTHALAVGLVPIFHTMPLLGQ